MIVVGFGTIITLLLLGTIHFIFRIPVILHVYEDFPGPGVTERGEV